METLKAIYAKMKESPKYLIDYKTFTTTLSQLKEAAQKENATHGNDVFLVFHQASSHLLLSHLLRSLTDMVYFIKRAAYFQPNSGPLWFRCQEFLSSSPKEVRLRPRSRPRRPRHRRVAETVLLRVQAGLHVPSPQPATTDDPENEGPLRRHTIG